MIQDSELSRRKFVEERAARVNDRYIKQRDKISRRGFVSTSAQYIAAFTLCGIMAAVAFEHDIPEDQAAKKPDEKKESNKPSEQEEDKTIVGSIANDCSATGLNYVVSNLLTKVTGHVPTSLYNSLMSLASPNPTEMMQNLKSCINQLEGNFKIQAFAITMRALVNSIFESGLFSLSTALGAKSSFASAVRIGINALWANVRFNIPGERHRIDPLTMKRDFSNIEKVRHVSLINSIPLPTVVVALHCELLAKKYGALAHFFRVPLYCFDGFIRAFTLLKRRVDYNMQLEHSKSEDL